MADERPKGPQISPITKVETTKLDTSGPGQTNFVTDFATQMANAYGLYIVIDGLHSNSSIKFRAFLTSFNESFSSKLKSEELVGHYEPLRKVTGVERIVSIGLSLPAFSLEDSRRNLLEIRNFIKMLYPRTESSEASQTGGIQQKYVKSGGDPIFRVKFANLIANSKATLSDTESINTKEISTSGQKGYIDNVNYDFDIEQGFYVTTNGYTYPKLITLTFNFYPLHEVSPSWTERGFDHINLPYNIQDTLPTGVDTPGTTEDAGKTPIQIVDANINNIFSLS